MILKESRKGTLHQRQGSSSNVIDAFKSRLQFGLIVMVKNGEKVDIANILINLELPRIFYELFYKQGLVVVGYLLDSCRRAVGIQELRVES